MTAETDLLPCPFCGNEVQDDEGCFQSGGFRFPASPVWSVRCGNPECNADVSAASEATTVAAWNRRATAAKDAEIEALREQLAEAWDGWHMANGTADLAMKHRHEAEARAERLAEALRMMVEMVEMSGFGKAAAIDTARTALRDAALHPTAAQEDGRE